MNPLKKLAKEKYNGDLTAAWRYVLYEASEEEREYYMKYVSKEQLDIGMTALKKGERNEIDELADSKFNGDLKKTWDYIFSSCTAEEIEKYTSIATPHQAGMAVLLVDGLRKNRTYRRLERIEKNMTLLKMSREEVLHTAKNPYAGQLLKSVLGVVVAIALIIGLTVVGSNMGWNTDAVTATDGFLGIVCSCFAFDLAKALRYYVMFSGTKKALKKAEEERSRESV